MRLAVFAAAAATLAACQPASNPAPAPAAAASPAASPTAAAAEAPAVFFVNLTDGQEVTSPVHVVFGMKGEGWSVQPAGVEMAHSGHHHLLIDTELTGEALDYAVPNDAQHMHFGKGQTEADIELAPGKHTLQLILGDHLHVPHKPPIMSEKITITVK